MAPQPTAKSVAADYAFAVYGNVFVQLWRGAATLEAVETLARFDGILARQGDSKSASSRTIFVIVDRFLSFPSERVREAFTKRAREGQPTCALVVYEQEGFAAAALRAIVTGLLTVGGRRHSVKLFPSVAAAVSWAVSDGRNLPDLGELESLIASLRSEVDALAKTAPTGRPPPVETKATPDAQRKSETH